MSPVFSLPPEDRGLTAFLLLSSLGEGWRWWWWQVNQVRARMLRRCSLVVGLVCRVGCVLVWVLVRVPVLVGMEVKVGVAVGAGPWGRGRGEGCGCNICVVICCLSRASHYSVSVFIVRVFTSWRCSLLP